MKNHYLDLNKELRIMGRWLQQRQMPFGKIPFLLVYLTYWIPAERSKLSNADLSLTEGGKVVVHNSPNRQWTGKEWEVVDKLKDISSISYDPFLQQKMLNLLFPSANP